MWRLLKLDCCVSILKCCVFHIQKNISDLWVSVGKFDNIIMHPLLTRRYTAQGAYMTLMSDLVICSCWSGLWVGSAKRHKHHMTMLEDISDVYHNVETDIFTIIVTPLKAITVCIQFSIYSAWGLKSARAASAISLHSVIFSLMWASLLATFMSNVTHCNS